MSVHTQGDSTIAVVEEAIAHIADGRFVAVSDSHDREDEADLIIAAAHITSEQMAFLIHHTSGIICTPITQQRADQLQLARLESDNPSKFDTPFTMPVDYLPTTRGGVSAHERAATVRALADDAIEPDQFGRPGHVFPLIAAPGGVQERDGHTEAAIALMKHAQQPLVGVIGELMSKDGTMMRGADLAAFCSTFEITHISIEQLIAYEQQALADSLKKEYNV